MDKSKFDVFSRFSGGIGVGFFFAAIFLLARFYATGATTPDPKTMRVFYIPAHGPLYVTPEQGHLFYGLLVGFIALEILSYVMLRVSRN